MSLTMLEYALVFHVFVQLLLGAVLWGTYCCALLRVGIGCTGLEAAAYNIFLSRSSGRRSRRAFSINIDGKPPFASMWSSLPPLITISFVLRRVVGLPLFLNSV